jgi:hypothetical protein
VLWATMDISARAISLADRLPESNAPAAAASAHVAMIILFMTNTPGLLGVVRSVCLSFGRSMAALGHLRTRALSFVMSALPLKADIACAFMSTRP